MLIVIGLVRALCTGHKGSSVNVLSNVYVTVRSCDRHRHSCRQTDGRFQ